MENLGPARPAVSTGELNPCLPPMVYLPSQREAPGDDEAQLELRRLVDGRLAAVAYTTQERLVHSCGESQPWGPFTLAAVGMGVVAACGVGYVVDHHWDDIKDTTGDAVVAVGDGVGSAVRRVDEWLG